MTERQKDGITPIQSKKFLAYIVAELTTKGLMGWLITHIGTLDFYELCLLLGMLVSSSALTIGYILGTASLEKYLHAAVEIFDKEDQHLKKEIEQLKGLTDDEYHKKHKDKVYRGEEK
jgi:2-keto-3-deoxy-galactonokinase